MPARPCRETDSTSGRRMRTGGVSGRSISSRPSSRRICASGSSACTGLPSPPAEPANGLVATRHERDRMSRMLFMPASLAGPANRVGDGNIAEPGGRRGRTRRETRQNPARLVTWCSSGHQRDVRPGDPQRNARSLRCLWSRGGGRLSGPCCVWRRRPRRTGEDAAPSHPAAVARRADRCIDAPAVRRGAPGEQRAREQGRPSITGGANRGRESGGSARERGSGIRVALWVTPSSAERY